MDLFKALKEDLRQNEFDKDSFLIAVNDCINKHLDGLCTDKAKAHLQKVWPDFTALNGYTVERLSNDICIYRALSGEIQITQLLKTE